MKRVILIVLDSVGAGALPDAAAYGDVGSHTLGHIIAQAKPKLPNMEHMGLGLLDGVDVPVPPDAVGATGRAKERSKGKDTTTGHWEIAGLRLTQAFPTFPNGFPKALMEEFEKRIGTKTLGNRAESGTVILDELGEEHLRTGYPIVYTSADSVFQIACHEDLYPYEKLYEICRVARELLQGEYGVGRVIARPFVGTGRGDFKRTSHRHDFSLPPIGPTILDKLKEAGYDTIGVGKIEDIFCMQGIRESEHAAGNPACVDSLLRFMQEDRRGLIFVNLVDFDSVYGHRRDVQGYADALEYVDRRLDEIKDRMTDDDLLLLTADHGCDPTFTGTDHTREYIPILAWSKRMTGLCDLGTRESYADIAATVAELFGLEERFGATSFASLLYNNCK